MKNQYNLPTLFVLPPDPLHVVLLGPINDVMDKLEQLYPLEIKEEFYPKHHLKKSGEGPGGKFNGPSVKHILKEESLIDLEETLPTFEIAVKFTDYLRAVRYVHELSITKTFDPSTSKECLDNSSK